MNTGFDPITLALVLALMALLPTVVVVTTSFLKIAVVMSLLRNALGVQQVPPNLALYGMALILSAYIMAPVGSHMADRLTAQPETMRSVPALVSGVREGAEPLREFMLRNSKVEQRELETGETYGDKWLVLSGLQAGDKLIVEGSAKVMVGQQVNPVEMTSTGGKA